MRRGRVWSMPQSGTSPTLKNGIEICAERPITIKSASSAIEAPAPAAWPSTAATTGFSLPSSRRTARWPAFSRARMSRVVSGIEVRSPPPQKCPPAPVMIRPRTSSSASAASTAATKARRSSLLSALRRSGRFSAMRAMRSAGRSTRRISAIRFSPSVASREQAARDHLGLDLGGALEDVQDARIAQHAADRVFLGIAVAAMDLQRVIGVRPGDPRGEQLGHAGLDVAAPVLVLLARREIGELARHHGLDRHPGELAGDARELVERAAELPALVGIGQSELER